MKSQRPSIFHKAQGLLLGAALALTPLLIFRPAYEQFVMPKMAWLEALAVALLLLALLRGLSGQFVRVPTHATGLLLVLFVGWHVVVSGFARSPSLAWERTHWMVCLLVLSWQWQEWTWGRRGRVLAMLDAIGVCVGATALWVLYQDMTVQWAGRLPAWWPDFGVVVPRLADWRGSISAGLGNTDHIAAFFAVLYLPLLGRLLLLRGGGRDRVRRWGLMAALWLASAAMTLCWSVGNNGSLILATVVLFFVVGKRRRRWLWRRRRARILAWMAGCAVMVLWLTTNTPMNPHRPGLFQEAFGSERWKEGGPTRLIIWLNSLDMASKTPFLGVGPGNFIYVYPEMRSALIPDDPVWQRYVGAFTNAAHNTLLQTWAELGVVGVVVLVLVVAAGFRSLMRPLRQGREIDRWMALGALASFLALCLTSIMTFPLQLPVSTLLFFCLAPLGHSLGRPGRDERGFQMPAFSTEGAHYDLELITREMRRPVSIGGRLHLGKAASVVVFVVALALAGLWLREIGRPVVSDVYYHRGRRALAMGDVTGASGWFEKAWTVKPGHYDARINTVKILLAEGRPEEALRQLNIVWERLNSTELWQLRYQGLMEMGRKDEAMEALKRFVERQGGVVRGMQNAK